MIAAVALATLASFDLTCDVTEVDPMLGTEGRHRDRVSLLARNGRLTLSGASARLPGSNLRARAKGEGWDIEGQFDESVFAARTMATLTRVGEAYSLEWGVAEQNGRRGQWTYSTVVRGQCRRGSASLSRQGNQQ
jgi:hypothetical protein